MSIFNLLTQIDHDEVVLPAIQRDFVWDERKIQKLLDSIMRGYPIGLVIMWETYNDIQFRRFLRENISGNRAEFYDNSNQQKLRLVLDGQQRLQSLYISLFGKLDGQYIFFDVLSGRDKDDFEEEKYQFTFATDEEVKTRNNEMKKLLASSNGSPQSTLEANYLVPVHWLFKVDAKEKIRFRNKVGGELSLSEDNQLRLEENFARLDEALLKDQNILETVVIDENVPADSPSRQNESDVLEIFVRVNRQGTRLTRSDLIFSMLKLNWRESAADLPQFVEEINDGNSFHLDIDFVIRCLFAVSDLGTKFDVDLLRKKQNIELLRTNYEECCNSIRSTVDSVQEYCWISSSRALSGSLSIIPFVYYMFHLPGHQLPIQYATDFRKSLFLFAFSKVFSRYAESRLAKFIREELKSPEAGATRPFPLSGAIRWVRYWEAIRAFDQDLLQRNPRLAHYLVQGYRGTEAHFVPNSQEMDHIFPRAELRKQGKDDTEINHFANFWILSKGKNQNKSNKHPKHYFKDVPKSLLDQALIDREMLNYRQFRKFIKQRGVLIEQHLADQIGYLSEEFIEQIEEPV